jgi:hypothetical protein
MIPLNNRSEAMLIQIPTKPRDVQRTMKSAKGSLTTHIPAIEM